MKRPQRNEKETDAFRFFMHHIATFEDANQKNNAYEYLMELFESNYFLVSSDFKDPDFRRHWGNWWYREHPAEIGYHQTVDPEIRFAAALQMYLHLHKETFRSYWVVIVTDGYKKLIEELHTELPAELKHNLILLLAKLKDINKMAGEGKYTQSRYLNRPEFKHHAK